MIITLLNIDKIYIYFHWDKDQQCIDMDLQDVQNKEIMLANGWQMDISSNLPFWIQKITDRYCNSNTFYGFKPGPKVGKVMATFQGYGSATLDFGNCATQGFTSVFLNNEYIAHAGPNTLSKSISFQYNPGSTLLFNEFCSGIIKINSLKFDCICKHNLTYLYQMQSLCFQIPPVTIITYQN